MNESGAAARPSNPFSTRFIRPGAVGYLFAPGESAAAIVTRLARLGWRGQIIGPHGAGKSTLLAALAAPLAEAGKTAWSLTLAGGTRQMPRGWIDEAERAGADLVVIDGYEQLSAWNRLLTRARCRRRGWGLLVTAHGDVGLPRLIEIAPSLETTAAVVERLTAGQTARLAPEVVRESFAASGGNVRETLFLLYDRWQSLGAE